MWGLPQRKILQDLDLKIINDFLVSKETLVLRPWGSETQIWFIKRVDKG